jgi:hypothetical protein
MKRPTKKQIASLRIALAMTGVVAINDNVSELILVVQSEMKRLGGAYSLRDATSLADELNKLHLKEAEERSGKMQ